MATLHGEYLTSNESWSPRVLVVDIAFADKTKAIRLSTYLLPKTGNEYGLKSDRRMLTIGSEGFSFRAIPRHSRSAMGQGKSYEIGEVGDVVIKEDTSGIFSGVVDERYAGYFLERRALVIKVDGVNPHWLSALFVSNSFAKYRTLRGVQRLSYENIGNLMIPICSKDAQTRCQKAIDDALVYRRRELKVLTSMEDDLDRLFHCRIGGYTKYNKEGVSKCLRAISEWSPRKQMSNEYFYGYELVRLDIVADLEAFAKDGDSRLKVRRSAKNIVSDRYLSFVLSIPRYQNIIPRIKQRFLERGGLGPRLSYSLPIPPLGDQDWIMNELGDKLRELNRVRGEIKSINQIKSDIIDKEVRYAVESS